MDIELEWLQATLNDASEALQDALQKVENGVVYTIEGNSGNLCRVNRYPVGQYEIMGYGILRP